MRKKRKKILGAVLCGLLMWAGQAIADDSVRLVWAAARGQGFDLFTAVQEKNSWGPSARLVD